MPNIRVVCTGPSPLRLLFLCTGNYYRSRFAEILFNALATSTGLNWVAVSRGLATDRVSGKVGPISAYVVKGLEARGIALDLARSPEQVQEGDLRSAELVIALNESGHRVLVERQFPSGSDRVEYWRVNDVGIFPPDDAMAEIEEQIRDLILRLAESGH